MPITFGSADHSTTPVTDSLHDQMMKMMKRKRKAAANKAKARSSGSSLEDLLNARPPSPGVQSN